MTTPAENARWIAAAALELADAEVSFIGIGVPSLAAMLAKRTHAPGLTIIYESGAIDANPDIPPLSTGSPCVVRDTAMLTSCLGVFAMLQQGRFDSGLLSAAQVDRRGNLNSVRLDRRDRGPMLLVGSGGAHDIAVLARRIVILMPHDPRRFVEKVDHVTSPGHVRGGRGVRGGGPAKLVTPRGRFGFSGGELTLEAVFAGVDPDYALEGIPWDVPRAPFIETIAPAAEDIAAAGALLALSPGSL